MKSVGLRELKNRLSEYVRAVRAGERVLVTDRGEVIAELVPPGQGAGDKSIYSPGLLEMERRGEITLNGPNRPELYRKSKLRLPDGTAQRLIDEERGPR